jgi:hypothetical protein
MSNVGKDTKKYYHNRKEGRKMLRKRRKIRVQRTIYLTKDIDSRLNKYLENCGYYKSDVFDLAIDKFLKEVENEENSSN